MRAHRRKVAIVGVAAFMVLAGCTSSSSGPGAAGTQAGTAPKTGTTPGTAAPSVTTGITVPDAYTPITVTAISEPTFPFLGSDEKYHVVYDLLLTNANRVDATLDKLEVVDAFNPTKVLASFSGTQLVDPGCEPGDCDRLRVLASAPSPDASIPAQASRALYVDFTLDSLSNAPKAVLHHLYGTGASGPPARQATPIDYLTTPYDISAGTPRVIGPPVKGKNWVALNGCCTPGFPHRGSLTTVNGLLTNGQRFAIDWKQTNDAGAFFEGDPSKNESFIDYGADIVAVADGEIVNTLDEVEAGTPGTLPANDPVLGPKLTFQNVDGNFIVQDLGGGVFAMYAHLVKGSLLVKPGQKVKKGEKIAQLGNTGNSNASHMHFQLMSTPSTFASDGIPYVLDSFVYRGQVPQRLILETDDFLSGTFLGEAVPGQPRKEQLPMRLAIVDFP